MKDIESNACLATYLRYLETFLVGNYRILICGDPVLDQVYLCYIVPSFHLKYLPELLPTYLCR